MEYLINYEYNGAWYYITEEAFYRWINVIHLATPKIFLRIGTTNLLITIKPK